MKQGALLPVLVVNFIGTLGFTIVLPFLVFLVEAFGGNSIVYGAVGATYAFFQFFGAPMLGKWSDRVGRRKILALSQAGTLFAWGIFIVALVIPQSTLLEVSKGPLGAFSLTLPLVLLFLARAIDGLTGGNVSVANAYVADVSDDTNRAKNFGRMGVAASLGMVLGPAVASVIGLSPFPLLGPVLAAAVVSIVALVLIILRLPESRVASEPSLPCRGRVLGQEPRDCRAPVETSAWSLPGVKPWLAVYFILFLGFNFFYASFPMHALKGLQWEVSQTGIFFSFLSGVLVVVQGPVLSRLSQRWSALRLIVSGTLLLVVAFVTLSAGGATGAWIGAALYATGNGLMWPTLVATIAETGGREHQGAVQGLSGSAGSLASVIGLLLGGLSYEYLGAQTFLLSGSLMMVAVVGAVIAYRSYATPQLSG